jgi:hypothetical protein
MLGTYKQLAQLDERNSMEVKDVGANPMLFTKQFL